MKTQHTPGPWNRNIPPAYHYPVIYAGRNTHVAQVIHNGERNGQSAAETEANCNLIAAAPETLEALHTAAYALGNILLHYGSAMSNNDRAAHKKTLDALTAQINRAKGES